MTLTVIIPVYNEENTLKEIISRVISTGIASEIICVNDGSTDNSGKILSEIRNGSRTRVKVITHDSNFGKGAAIRSALKETEGEITVIQDADLEYDPSQFKKMLMLFENKDVKVVYGSRNLLKNPKSSQAFYWGGILLSRLTNVLYGSKITDESTCYKMFRTDLLRELNLECSGFDFCPEVTSKILKRKIVIYEVPINYAPRKHSEGKKIKWHDGVKAIWTLIKYRF